MTLFSAPGDPWSHRTRIVLAEKSIGIDVVDVEPGKYPEDLLDLNPYHTVPTLVDRDLVLYDWRVIIEYLDERFPHPPLDASRPGDAGAVPTRAYRIERDWYTLLQQIEVEEDKRHLPKLRKVMADTIVQGVDLFKVKPYFISDEFSLVDATIAPILWRLPHYEVEAATEGSAHPQIREPGLRPCRLSRVAFGAGARDAALRPAMLKLLPSVPTCFEPCTSGSPTAATRRM